MIVGDCNMKEPHSKEAEMMVLGNILTNRSALIEAARFMTAEDFYYPYHQSIFTLLSSLVGCNLLDDMGGASYLLELAQVAGTSCYIEEYIALVQNKAILRRLLSDRDEDDDGLR